MAYFATLTAVAVAALLTAEWYGSRAGVWISKPVAAAGFVGAALAAGALDSPYGLSVLAALVLSLCGDVCLIPRSAPRIFQAGLLCFLLGHLAFAGAFLLRGIAPPVAAVAAGLAVGVAVLVLRWLRPHVPAELRLPVHAYVLVISVMAILAAGATASAGEPRILLGALMFYCSDLAVARDRFVAPGFWNGAWGLPLYFGAQLVLASTVASASP